MRSESSRGLEILTLATYPPNLFSSNMNRMFACNIPRLIEVAAIPWASIGAKSFLLVASRLLSGPNSIMCQ